MKICPISASIQVSKSEIILNRGTPSRQYSKTKGMLTVIKNNSIKLLILLLATSLK